MNIEAYVVVGDDDHYCDQNGNMPESLKHEAEWAFFQAGLDAADIIVMGRRSHEITPNPKQRSRLVLTRKVTECMREGGHVYWNPAHASLRQALSLFEGSTERLAVVGGQVAFDLFLTAPLKYDRFHLSRIHGVQVPDGRGVFSATSPGTDAASILRSAGYDMVAYQTLAPGVDVFTWSQIAEPT